MEYDLDYYKVYRYIATDQGVLPDPVYWPLIGETEDNEFTDDEFAPRPGGPETAYYRVTALDTKWQESDFSDPVGSHGYYRPSADQITDINDITPQYLQLTANPNPFNPSTSLTYDLPENAFVSLKIYNVTGREVATLADGQRLAGTHTLSWDASSLPSGVYFAQIQAGEYHSVQKLLLTK